MSRSLSWRQKNSGCAWLRTSYFRDDEGHHPAPDRRHRHSSITRVSNVDRVLTQGIEMVAGARCRHPGLDIGGSATRTDAWSKANAANPAQVGKQWLRIPSSATPVQASYRPNAQWLLGAAWRWSGRAYNTELNIDSNPDTVAASRA